MTRWRKWRLRRAALALSDHVAHRKTWGFAYRDSEHDASLRREVRLRKRVAARGGNPAAVSEYGVDWESLAPVYLGPPETP